MGWLKPSAGLSGDSHPVAWHHCILLWGLISLTRLNLSYTIDYILGILLNIIFSYVGRSPIGI